MIKYQEAQHIGKTYDVIIRNLEKQRLAYDPHIEGLTETQEARKKEMVC